jgi:hypothetical protein
MGTKFLTTENKTGWIVYYISDQSGCGANRPNYLYLPWEDQGEIKDEIIENHESWVWDASSYSLEIELGIVPPAEVLDQEINKLSESIAWKTKLREKLLQQKDEFHGGLVRN